MQQGHFVIAVKADTHSGDLGELDLQKAAVLHAAGVQYRPVAPVEFSGHHGEAQMAFALHEAPDTFVVTISGVRSMEPQRFEWS
jgi:hypothetical protein